MGRWLPAVFCGIAAFVLIVIVVQQFLGHLDAPALRMNAEGFSIIDRKGSYSISWISVRTVKVNPGQRPSMTISAAPAALGAEQALPPDADELLVELRLSAYPQYQTILETVRRYVGDSRYKDDAQTRKELVIAQTEPLWKGLLIIFALCGIALFLSLKFGL